MQIPEFGNIYNIYCARCKRNGAMDFDDLLLQTNILLRDCPDVTARYQEQFKYILVDEYQDTNYAQYVIIRRLSQLHSKVCVVGDDAQSIYSFRGAKIENILSFKKDFPNAMIFKLEQNYRSTRTIVEAANSVIERNSKRMEKKCFSEGDMGEKIRVLRAYTDREEAEMVVSDLRDKVRAAGDEWAEAAILYRTNNQSQALEDALRRKGIPYRIYKGNSFYDHKEIKDLLAYIRLVINPRDDEAFKRIVNYPARGIGDTTVERIALLAKARNLSMWEAVDALTAEPVTDPVRRPSSAKWPSSWPSSGGCRWPGPKRGCTTWDSKLRPVRVSSALTGPRTPLRRPVRWTISRSCSTRCSSSTSSARPRSGPGNVSKRSGLRSRSGCRG